MPLLSSQVLRQATMKLYFTLLFMGSTGFALTSSPHQPAEPQTREVAAEQAEKFITAWSQSNFRSVKRLVDFPFLLYLPCKSAPVESWEDWEQRLGIVALGKNFRLETVVISLPEYLRSLRMPEQRIIDDEKILGPGVLVACMRNRDNPDSGLAVLVRMRPGANRVVGIGILPASNPLP